MRSHPLAYKSPEQMALILARLSPVRRFRLYALSAVLSVGIIGAILRAVAEWLDSPGEKTVVVDHLTAAAEG